MREFAAGDRIIFLENARFLEPRARGNSPQYVRNGMFGTVVSTGNALRAPLLSVRLDSGGEIVLSEDSYRNIDHGYAVTIHKSQGATVDRTLVLASGMMDRHLTYVSMTRHRHRADLYAAREDFRPEREDKAPVDHAKGITGELVETGVTKFRPGDEGTNDTPYADLKVEGGKIHRLRGVSLPAALSAAGASKGDTVTLRKDGVETVKVKLQSLMHRRAKGALRNARLNAMSGRRSCMKPQMSAAKALNGKATHRNCSGNWPGASGARAPKPRRWILLARLATRHMSRTLPAGVALNYLAGLPLAQGRSKTPDGVAGAKAPAGGKSPGAGRCGARFGNRSGTQGFLS